MAAFFEWKKANVSKFCQERGNLGEVLIVLFKKNSFFFFDGLCVSQTLFPTFQRFVRWVDGAVSVSIIFITGLHSISQCVINL